ncbi:MAG: biotin--[acetyl-CoA-carboxylase] ligase [Campylobacterota bacterium]|nr:biotin--[acetyl-CoA-carboxylase] ligase [Campylobacterota bacterium]
MQIRYLESVNSTQIHLKELLLKKKVKPPYAVVTNSQTDGIGSRDNSWIEMDGNLYLSFALELKELPNDLKLESASIYFAFLLQDVLNNLNSSLWLKWPNDFYIGDSKLGGMITNIVDNVLICGVGLNLVNSPKGFTALDIEISREELLEKYFENIEKKLSWKQVFSKYKLEFYRNQKFFTHNQNLKISLSEAELQSDGSIMINNERIYSLR